MCVTAFTFDDIKHDSTVGLKVTLDDFAIGLSCRCKVGIRHDGNDGQSPLT